MLLLHYLPVLITAFVVAVIATPIMGEIARKTGIVDRPDEARKLGLEIDHDDSHAVANNNVSFALLLHGVQKAGSEASNALKRMNKEQIQYRYGRGKQNGI